MDWSVCQPKVYFGSFDPYLPRAASGLWYEDIIGRHGPAYIDYSLQCALYILPFGAFEQDCRDTGASAQIRPSAYPDPIIDGFFYLC